MLRAVLVKGRIEALEPLPNNWHDGLALVVNQAGANTTGEQRRLTREQMEDIDRWYENFQKVGTPFADSQDEATFDATLAGFEARRSRRF